MTGTFRCQLVLMTLGEYAYGDHVSDPAAFVRRCQTIRALAGRINLVTNVLGGPFEYVTRDR